MAIANAIEKSEIDEADDEVSSEGVSINTLTAALSAGLHPRWWGRKAASRTLLRISANVTGCFGGT